MATKSKRRCDQLPVLHPDAAGIDIGASELFVAVAADRDTDPVRSFATFTQDLNALAGWLQRWGIKVCSEGIHNRLLDSGVPDPGVLRV